MDSKIHPLPRVLLVEDEAHLAFTLQFNLQAEGFEVVPAANGALGLDKFLNEGPFAVVILDVMLPEMNGFEVAQKIRERDPTTGILMLTARASDADRIRGLGIGVDDYITKPFHLAELLMKIKRTAARSRLFEERVEPVLNGTRPLVKYGQFTLNMETLALTGRDSLHNLTALEADILKTFIENMGKVLSRDFLLDNVWKVSTGIETRTVDNFIVRLRRYLEDNPAKPKFLVSIRGRGYRLLPTEDHGINKR
jgi:DNA-binding response OmpR family regulator